MPGSSERWVQIDIDSQRLTLFKGRQRIRHWPVSTALKGTGELAESACTPRGEHRVRIKIGRACPVNTVFIGRRPTGEIYDDVLAAQQPQRDWILSRIIWLTGAESGHNRGGECDTLRRYIYIHGCPDCEPVGVPVSHGCIRMRNADVIELFELVEAGTRVVITERSSHT
jgi:hypothetical protein